MKYITTDKHPEFKKGIEISISGGNIQKEEMYRDAVGKWKANDLIITNCIEKGYIKEVEEPEFTKSDLIEICYMRFGGNRKYFEKHLNITIGNWKMINKL